MKTKFCFCVSFVVFFVFAQLSIAIASPPTVSLDKAFKIPFGEKVQITSENITIDFKDARVTRCPSGAMCFVPDNVAVFLEVNKNSEPTLNIKLNNELSSQTAAAYQMYEIKLLKLEPKLKKESAPYNKKDIVISLIVTKPSK